jgi:hypothetical protein
MEDEAVHVASMAVFGPKLKPGEMLIVQVGDKPAVIFDAPPDMPHVGTPKA